MLKISKQKTIGIVGNGQLGMMLREAAEKLGFSVIMLDDFKSKEKILGLGSKVDFITFEIESANIEALEELKAEGIPVNPDPEILKIIKDKYSQKVFLQDYGIPVADIALIENETQAEEAGVAFGYPFMLKSRFDAYDGRGNFVVKNKSEISEAFQKLAKENSNSLYAEKFVNFKKELAVISARDMFGSVESYEVVETIHKNNICHVVRSPAPVSDAIKSKAKEVAGKVLQALNGVGVFAVEMFLTDEGKILVNEIAPRVHNSGHHTIEQYSASQFEQHIRAITGMHILKPLAINKASVMVNILGEREGRAELTGQDRAESISGVKTHIYGKLETRKERKMGHITAVGDNLDEVEIKALQARKHMSI